MFTILISDQHCTVADDKTKTDQYTYHYEDFVGGSVEAYELAEELCNKLNGKKEYND